MQKTLAAVLVLLVAFAVSAADTYQKPPAELARLVDAPLVPLVSVSPDEKTLLLLTRPALPPAAVVSMQVTRSVAKRGT